MQFVIYEAVIGALLRSKYSHWNEVLLSCTWHTISSTLPKQHEIIFAQRFQNNMKSYGLSYFNKISHTPASKVVC